MPDRTMGTRELLELVTAVLLFPPRFAVMAVAEVLAYLACCIAITGHDPAVPLVPWRRQLVRHVVVPCCRVVLATIGIWSVRIEGVPDPAAKLVVCNHVCLLDGFVLVATLGAPSFVARLEGLAAVPLYGTIVRALQVLFVSRQDTASRRECAEAIADRAQAAAGEWPRRKLQMQALVPPPGPSECLPQLPSLPAALTHSCRRSA